MVNHSHLINIKKIENYLGNSLFNPKINGFTLLKWIVIFHGVNKLHYLLRKYNG
jgi:hypothetical protein